MRTARPFAAHSLNEDSTACARPDPSLCARPAPALARTLRMPSSSESFRQILLFFNCVAVLGLFLFVVSRERGGIGVVFVLSLLFLRREESLFLVGIFRRRRSLCQRICVDEI